MSKLALAGTVLGGRVEIFTPVRWRKPLYDHPVKYYTRKTIPVTAIIPSGDGYREIRGFMEDTPEGHVKHRNEQRRILGMRPIDLYDELVPPIRYAEEWRIPVSVWGNRSTLEVGFAEGDTPRSVVLRVWSSIGRELLDKHYPTPSARP